MIAAHCAHAAAALLPCWPFRAPPVQRDLRQQARVVMQEPTPVQQGSPLEQHSTYTGAVCCAVQLTQARADVNHFLQTQQQRRTAFEASWALAVQRTSSPSLAKAAAALPTCDSSTACRICTDTTTTTNMCSALTTSHLAHALTHFEQLLRHGASHLCQCNKQRPPATEHNHRYKRHEQS